MLAGFFPPPLHFRTFTLSPIFSFYLLNAGFVQPHLRNFVELALVPLSLFFLRVYCTHEWLFTFPITTIFSTPSNLFSSPLGGAVIPLVLVVFFTPLFLFTYPECSCHPYGARFRLGFINPSIGCGTLDLLAPPNRCVPITLMPTTLVPLCFFLPNFVSATLLHHDGCPALSNLTGSLNLFYTFTHGLACPF